ncbi:MAG TPA: DUF1028 domain-containing protein, partial [Actinomycetes bacterium]|nr:DUF1028 domain-containing protein [Actinomycetes bacterium]
FSGKQILGVYNSAESPGSIAAGNLLRTAEVPQAMVDAFQGTSGELETRLLRGLQAGLQVGGETGPVHSAGLATVRSVPWRDTDLRVDWAERAPIAQLADLVERWLPQRDAYVTRAIDPASAPSYGVPGDD